MGKMKREIIEMYDTNFAYDDYDVVGYIVGGELTTTKPTKREQRLFDGDWSPVTLADVWSYIHNADRQPVSFRDTEDGQDVFTIYYPRWNDDISFRVVRFRFIEQW